MSDARAFPEPQERLTRLCETMTNALEEHPEFGPDVRAVAMVDSLEERRGGLQTFGWDDWMTAAKFMESNLKAIYEANGVDIVILRKGQG